MITRRRRSTRRATVRRVRRNPPKMTTAMRAKIGARIRALHRSGKYRKLYRTRKVRRAVGRVTSIFRRSSRRASPRRSAARRRSVFRGAAAAGGAIGIKSLVSRNNLMLAGGALAGIFVANYTTALVVPRLPASLQGNPFVRAAIKVAAAGLAAKLVSRYSRPVAQGMLIGGAIVVANDLIRQFAPGLSANTTAAYLGGRRAPMAAYLGNAPAPVSMVRKTFAPAVNGVYGGGSAFKQDAWSR